MLSLPVTDDNPVQYLDNGRLQVCAAFRELFAQHGLMTCAAFDELTGEVAKNLLAERTTLRFTLNAADGCEQAFYIKRHTPPPLKEYIKPWLRLTRPILGARNEWLALHHFQQAGIDSMQPAALGQQGGCSFLVTAAITDCVKLSDLLVSSAEPPAQTVVEALADKIADVAARMHSAGLHHQDFYLTHLLVPADDVLSRLYVIDLGRVQRRQRLGTRWVVKDLAQLMYSTTGATHWDDARFLQQYFDLAGEKSVTTRQRLTRRIHNKVARIAAHSRKNRL